MRWLRLPHASLIAAVIVLAACGGQDPGPRKSAGDGPASSGGSVADGARSTSVGVLKPGRYRTSLFNPRVTFEVGKGWRVAEEASDHILILRRPEPQDEAIYLDSSQRDLGVDEAVWGARAAFASTTGAVRDFLFSGVAPMAIGDYHGRGITMTLRTDQPVVTLALATEAYEVRPEDKLQLNAIDVNGEAVLVFVEAPNQRFSAFLKEARSVLASLDF